MEKSDFKTALDILKTSEKRKFVQAVDLVVNLKNLDLKKPEQQVDLFVQVPHARGKKVRTCCLCGPELLANAKQHCDLAIMTDEFSRYQQDKKAVKKLAGEYDWFIAQANIMPDVAKTFGRVLGPKGKMPNPKAGMVVPPNANLKPLVDKLSKTVRLSAKAQLCVKARIGREDQPESEIIDNAFTLTESLLKALPQEKNNIKNVLLKLTMSRPVPVGVSAEDVKKRWDERVQRQDQARKQREERAKLIAETQPKRRKAESAAPAPPAEQPPAAIEGSPESKQKKRKSKKGEEAQAPQQEQ